MIKAKKKQQQLHPIVYNLLTVQDLWQAHYQILLTILQKEYVTMYMMITNVKQNFKDNLV